MYESRHLQVEAVQWDGTNTDEVVALAGAENCVTAGGRFQIRSTLEPCVYRDMYPGYWVSKDGEGFTCLHSPQSFARFWRPVT